MLCGIKSSRGNSEICYNFQNVRIFVIAQISAAIKEDVSPALQWQRRNVNAVISETFRNMVALDTLKEVHVKRKCFVSSATLHIVQFGVTPRNLCFTLCA